jgi:hypothetical protein
MAEEAGIMAAAISCAWSRSKLAWATVACAAFLALPASAAANGNLHFVGEPGTAAPPATLGPYAMQEFGKDPTAEGTSETSLSGPTGAVSFSHALTHDIVGTTWGSWSNGYTSDVYYMGETPPELTITLPAGTGAFYMYVEPDEGGPFTFTATAHDGIAADETSSPPISIAGSAGAKYLGFWASGSASVESITLTNPAGADGFAIGELAIESPPRASTTAASSVTPSGATLNGSVNPEGTQTEYDFEYGTSALYGQLAPTPALSAGSGSSPVSAPTTISGLQPATTYHYRVVATNAFGQVARGEDMSFKTSAAPAPAATTAAASSVSSSSAQLNGSVDPNGYATTDRFEYGTGTAYGQSSPAPEQSAGSGTSAQAVGTVLAGLQPGTTYHYRVVATNAFGEATDGADATFTTSGATVSLVGRPHASTKGVTLTLACATAPCKVTVALSTSERLKSGKVVGLAASSGATSRTVALGAVTVTLQAGTTKTLTVALGASAKKLIARFKKLPLALTVSLPGATGKPAVVKTVTVTVTGGPGPR